MSSDNSISQNFYSKNAGLHKKSDTKRRARETQCTRGGSILACLLTNPGLFAHQPNVILNFSNLSRSLLISPDSLPEEGRRPASLEHKLAPVHEQAALRKHIRVQMFVSSMVQDLTLRLLWLIAQHGQSKQEHPSVACAPAAYQIQCARPLINLGSSCHHSRHLRL